MWGVNELYLGDERPYSREGHRGKWWADREAKKEVM